MKKLVSLLCTFSIISSSHVFYVRADEIKNTTDAQQTEGEGIEDANQLEAVKELTLEDVIERGTENSKNLAILQLNLEIAKREKSRFKNEELKIQEEEAIEGVKQLLTSKYTNLLLQEKQIDVMEQSLLLTVREVNKYEIFYKLGRITLNELNQVHKKLSDAEKKLKERKENYQRSLSELCLDIGILNSSDIVMQSIEFKPIKLEVPEDYTSIIENSFTMKRAQQKLDSAYSERRKVYQKYRKGDAKESDKETQDSLVEIAKINFELTKDDLKISIEDLYRNAEKSFAAYEEASGKLEEARKEMEAKELLYKLGRISTDEYEQTKLNVESAELAVFQAQIENYMMKQSIDGLEKGYI